jgi:hypothetical protein
MAKLKELENLYARLLGMNKGSIHVLAMMLRKERLIRSAGRGLNAAEMGASDATNLLLAGLGGGMPTKAAATVRNLRSAPLWRTAYRSREGSAWQHYEFIEELRILDPEPEPPPFYNLPAELRHLPLDMNVGQALDALFQSLITSGQNRIASLVLANTEHTTMIKIRITEGGEVWTSTFLALPPKHTTTWVVTNIVVMGELFGIVGDVLGNR